MKAFNDHVIRWIPIAVAAGFLVLTVSFDVFELPDQAYYGTAAQIIPVLIVALAVELQGKPRLEAATAFTLQLFVFLLGGELAALLGASGALGSDANDLLAAGTSAGLAGGFVAVVLVALLGPQAVMGQRRASGQRGPGADEPQAQVPEKPL